MYLFHHSFEIYFNVITNSNRLMLVIIIIIMKNFNAIPMVTMAQNHTFYTPAHAEAD